MSSDLAIAVRGVSKRYTISHRNNASALSEAITSWAGSLLRRPAKHTFAALSAIDLDVREGDIVGVVGRNGAGKSTLLKVLSRITEPTEGEIHLFGRVGALLEVGSGFHPELTGRENVFLNGAILGLSRREIGRRFDEIVEFAEVEQFIDTPVKRYSSGMHVRLAFAVAAHVLPEILIIDEVLAVGDTAFQKKCLGRMGDAAREGRTVLFVSHNMQVVNALCTRGVLLEDGRLTFDGDVPGCVERYQASLGSAAGQATFEPRFDDLGLLSVELRQPRHHGALRSTDPIEVVAQVRAVGIPEDELICGLTLLDPYGNRVLSSYLGDLREHYGIATFDGDYELVCTIPANVLNEGEHRLVFDVGIHNVRKATEDDVHAVAFEVVNVDGVGARFGLGRGWRDTPLLPHFPWTATPAAEQPVPTTVPQPQEARR